MKLSASPIANCEPPPTTTMRGFFIRRPFSWFSWSVERDDAAVNDGGLRPSELVGIENVFEDRGDVWLVSPARHDRCRDIAPPRRVLVRRRIGQHAQCGRVGRQPRGRAMP